jgi:L-threonylcarbamoyladenylate synthase
MQTRETMTEIIKINRASPEKEAILRAVEFLKKGEVVAYPTETFYGLGVDIYNEKAIKRLFRLKQRDWGLPISILVSDMEMLASVVMEVSDQVKGLIEAFWPGPLTILFPAAPSVSKSLTTNTGKIGIRISSDPIATKIVSEFGRPITTTSANLSGFPPSLNIKHVLNYFKDRLPCAVDGGECEPSKGSTVVDVVGDTMAIIRDGAIPADEVISRFQGI